MCVYSVMLPHPNAHTCSNWLEISKFKTWLETYELFFLVIILVFSSPRYSNTYINKSETTDLFLCISMMISCFWLKRNVYQASFMVVDYIFIWQILTLCGLKHIWKCSRWRFISFIHEDELPHSSASLNQLISCVLYLFMMLPMKTNIPVLSPSCRLKTFLSHRLSHGMNSKKCIINYLVLFLNFLSRN
jgi:hypothetical protein